MARIETPQRIRGTQDIAFDDARRFARVLEAFERVRRLYCFQRIEVPIFEATAVFARSLGETTDVVSKEMYTFEDRGGDSLTLRPEFTAGIARAYIGNGWQQHAPMKLATSGPAFRYERPQKGRFRQFHQLDVEIIGAAEPAADVEVILFAWHLLEELGLTGGATLRLNTLGDAASREAWRAGLVEHFERHRGALSRESLDRLERNPLRILDSKEACDRPAADGAPTIDAYLSDDARAFFADVAARLDAAGIPWDRDARLVRGLDYYRHTAFEIVTDRLGAQGQLVGGGRYDGLIEAMGGPPTPAVGWGCGLERLAMMIDEPAAERADVIVVVEDDRADRHGAAAAAALRRAGLSAGLIATGSPRKRYDKAVKASPHRILSVGFDESGPTTRLKLFDGLAAPVEAALRNVDWTSPHP